MLAVSCFFAGTARMLLGGHRTLGRVVHDQREDVRAAVMADGIESVPLVSGNLRVDLCGEDPFFLDQRSG